MLLRDIKTELLNVQKQMNNDTAIRNELKRLQDEVWGKLGEGTSLLPYLTNTRYYNHYLSMVKRILVTPIGSEDFINWGEAFNINVRNIAYTKHSLNSAGVSVYLNDDSYFDIWNDSGVYNDAVMFLFGVSLWFGDVPDDIKQLIGVE